MRALKSGFAFRFLCVFFSPDMTFHDLHNLCEQKKKKKKRPCYSGMKNKEAAKDATNLGGWRRGGQNNDYLKIDHKNDDLFLAL